MILQVLRVDRAVCLSFSVFIETILDLQVSGPGLAPACETVFRDFEPISTASERPGSLQLLSFHQSLGMGPDGLGPCRNR